MNVRAITSVEELCELERAWNALAETNPFLSWDWLTTWWRVYGAARLTGGPSRRSLFVLTACDEADSTRLVGLAPLYLDRTVTRGNVLRFLGTGEVCTDHLSVVCRPDDVQRVAESLAELLAHRDDWDAIDLQCVDANDRSLSALVEALQDRACNVSAQPADACWRITLPSTWDEYLAQLSKSHRKQVRQAERRVLETDRAVWHQVTDETKFSLAWNILIDLHQRRRKSLGEAGCFASRTFHQFHHQIALRLLQKDQLRLSWLELDGTPVAAEYHVTDGQITYAYQGGVDPQRLEEEPGRLSMILCLKDAIHAGHRTFDLLRGNEPYKAHWRAEPQPTVDYRIVPNRRLARLRGRVLQAATGFADWMRTGQEAIVSTPTGGVP